VLELDDLGENIRGEALDSWKFHGFLRFLMARRVMSIEGRLPRRPTLSLDRLPVALGSLLCAARAGSSSKRSRRGAT
jgi:hypothetical protein